MNEFILSQEDLERIAGYMLDEIKGQVGVVSRFSKVTSDLTHFEEGKSSSGFNLKSYISLENMAKGEHSICEAREIGSEHVFTDITVARDLQPGRFVFDHKGVALPKDPVSFVENVPNNFQRYDEEMRAFTESHPMAFIQRQLEILHRIVVNSEGGVAIERVPFFNISYNHGYSPMTSCRNACAVCRTEDDIARMTDLIKLMADPTPDGRIRNAGSFSEAFDMLYQMSRLKYGTLEEAGIPNKSLHDVVMLSGVSVHEIFGHHFEEPIHFLNFGDTATFRHNQEISNSEFEMRDDPTQLCEGFNTNGYEHFDAYGRERNPTIHVRDGKVLEFLGGEYIDTEKLKDYMNMDSSHFVGASRQDPVGFPQPRMSCTVLDGKTQDVDLDGKVLIVPSGGQTNLNDKTYQVYSYECYVLRDGEPMRILPLRISGSINHAMENMVLLPDWTYQAGKCGKSNPLSPHETSWVPVSQMCRNQIWQDQQLYPNPIQDKHIKILQK